MPDMLPIATRWYDRRSDEPLVMSSWMRSWKRGPNTRHLDSRAYWAYSRDIIGRLLMRPDVKLRVAHAPGRPDDVVGWVCWSVVVDLPVIHYGYVKQEHRHRAVFRRLAAEFGVSPSSSVAYTFRSPQTKYLAALVAEAEYYPVERFVA